MLIAWQILWHKKFRFFLSSAGIAMACIVMFVEQGFFIGIVNSQSNIAGLINGDLVVLHRTRTHLNKYNSFDSIRAFQIRGQDSIASVVPVYKTTMGLRNRDTQQIKRIIVYAFPPETSPLNLTDSATDIARLKIPYSVLYDRKSRNIYGPISDEIELDKRYYRVAGYISLGPNIIRDGAVLMSLGQFLSVKPRHQPIMAVIKLKQSTDISDVKKYIEATYPDLIALTPEDLAIREINFTSTSAPVGIIFGIGMLAGFVIGIIICYQVLFNEISDCLPQYATLKAIGFSNLYMGKIIVEQALLLSIAGYSLSLPVVMLLYSEISRLTLLPVYLTQENALFLLFLTVLMCVLAGLVAMRNLWRLDPAELF